MGTTSMKTLTDAELNVLASAEIESGMQGLTLDSKVRDVFKDSLEYVSFIVVLKENGLSDEAAAHAETLGELANAITVPN